MLNAEFDSRSAAQINRLYKMTPMWQHHMHDELSRDLAKIAEDYMKPLMHVRTQHTGALENSIKPLITKTGSGWDVNYTGLFYGLYMDNGNFPASQVLDAGSYGHKVFPVDRRLGNTKFQRHIHGMGSITPQAPTHYSEKTVQWLAEGKAIEISQEKLWNFLNEVIIL